MANKRKRINLALQGGGAHGAFTWGVLDRLLADDDLEIAAISGTSAGALNGAALKAGLVLGDRRTARDNLDWLWGQVGAVDEQDLAGWLHGYAPSAASVSRAVGMSLPFTFLDNAARMFSPYALGPLYSNPLQRIADRFSYDAVCHSDGPTLFICATNVRSGKIRVFTGPEISTDVIVASACLPTLFQAVEIDDPVTGKREAYWDGGYTGNPALFPLFAPSLPDDIVIVNINPLERRELPVSVAEIQNRINEISFNSSLLRELRAIQFVKELIAEGKIPKGAMKDVQVHMIADDGLMNELSVATKTIPTPYILAKLKEAGQAAAENYLTAHKSDIGVRGSHDLHTLID